MRRLLLAGLAAGGAAGYLLSLSRPDPLLGLVCKPVPVLCLAAAIGERPGRYARLVALGLLLSAIGDALLEGSGSRFFLGGMLAFLLGHLGYAGAFLYDTRRPAALLALPFAAWMVAVFGVLRHGMGPLAAPVAVYMAAIATMMWRAAARVGHAPAATAWTGVAGAVLFGLSDSLIALNQFHAPIAGVAYPIILLYWLGQAGIALSARPLRQRRSPTQSGEDLT